MKYIENLEYSNKGKDSINFSPIIILLSFYFFFCPLEFLLNVISPVGSPMKYLMAIIILLVIVYSYKEKLLLKFGLIQIAMGLWCLLEVSSYFWSPRSEYAIIYIPSYLNITFFFILISCFRYKKHHVNLFLNATILGSSVASVIMLSTMSLYHGVGIRYSLSLFGAESDPNNTAAFLVYGVVILFYKILFIKKYKTINLVLFSLNLVALFFTGSRGGFIAAGSSLIIILLFNFNNNNNRHELISKILKFVGIFLLTFVIVTAFLPTDLIDRVFNIDSYSSGSDRTIIWDVGINYIKENPILGHGIGSFLHYSANYFGTLKGMHNSYLMVLFETGILGFFFFIGSIILMSIKAIRQKNYFAFALLLAGLIPSIFLDALVKRFFWNGLILCIIMISVSRNTTSKEIKELSEKEI
jgi:O-antigen ligase